MAKKSANKSNRSSNSSSRSVMGKLLPPIDITDNSQLGELDKRISIGPITLVLIYADWCGHCKKFKPMMDSLEQLPQRSVQIARVRDNVLPNSAVANIPNEGYPSLMLVKPDGTAATFQTKEGKTTNVIPDHTDEQKMTALITQAGTPEGVSLLNSSQPANEIQEMSPPSASNMSMLTQETAAGSTGSQPPSSILGDRLSSESVGTLNRNMNRSYTKLKESQYPAGSGSLSGGGRGSSRSQGGGGLWRALYSASQGLAPAAALFLGAIATNKTRRASKKRRASTRKGSKKLTR